MIYEPSYDWVALLKSLWWIGFSFINYIFKLVVSLGFFGRHFNLSTTYLEIKFCDLISEIFLWIPNPIKSSASLILPNSEFILKFRMHHICTLVCFFPKYLVQKKTFPYISDDYDTRIQKTTYKVCLFTYVLLSNQRHNSVFVFGIALSGHDETWK